MGFPAESKVSWGRQRSVFGSCGSSANRAGGVRPVLSITRNVLLVTEEGATGRLKVTRSSSLTWISLVVQPMCPGDTGTHPSEQETISNVPPTGTGERVRTERCAKASGASPAAATMSQAAREERRRDRRWDIGTSAKASGVPPGGHPLVPTSARRVRAGVLAAPLAPRELARHALALLEHAQGVAAADLLDRLVGVAAPEELGDQVR